MTACIDYIEHVQPCARIPGHGDMCACGCDAYGGWCIENLMVGIYALFGFEWRF